MEVIVDVIDLNKYNKKLDEVVEEMINDLIKMMNERKEKHNLTDTISFAYFRYLLLKCSVVLSQSIEKKIVNLLENADHDMLKGLFEKS